jgi:hypothetical protein
MAFDEKELGCRERERRFQRLGREGDRLEGEWKRFDGKSDGGSISCK